MDYATALIEQDELLDALVRDADPSTPVPTCPGWTLRQLVRHVGRGHRWAGQIVRDRMGAPLDPRAVVDGKPPDDADGESAWLRGSSRVLLDAVAATGADVPVWTFLGPRPAGWWVRRRLHESTVHRADAALALGADYALPAALAADGVSESLDLIAAARGDRPSPLEAGQSLHLHATDGDLGPAGEWTVRAETGGVGWELGHAKATAAVRGPAVELLLALTNRRPIDEGAVEVLGERAVLTTWLERTAF
jgi:uncharacterized protein (TIGR03083 family)